MPKPRFPHLRHEKSRHGRMMYFLRIGNGRRVRLRADYGSQAFATEYALAFATLSGDAPVMLPAPVPKKKTVDREPHIEIDDRKREAIIAQIPQEILREANETSSFVYFIRSNKLVKIGYTRDVKQRLTTLKIGNHEKLELLFSLRGGLKLEDYFHSLFSKDHARGEWFKFSDRIRYFLSAKPYVDPEPPKAEGGREWRL